MLIFHFVVLLIFALVNIKMGFFQKLKEFGSKIVRGVKKGWAWLKDKAAPVIRKVLPIAKTAATAIGTAFGHPEAGAIAEKVGGVVDTGLRMIGR